MKYHTIKEIADTINVTKPNVYQHYKHLKQNRGAKFTKHIKVSNKILLDNLAYNLMLKSFKKVNSNRSVMLVKSYQARIADLEYEVKSLTQDKNHLYNALSNSQQLNKTMQLKQAQPTKEIAQSHRKINNKKQSIWTRLINLLKR